MRAFLAIDDKTNIYRLVACPDKRKGSSLTAYHQESPPLKLDPYRAEKRKVDPKEPQHGYYDFEFMDVGVTFKTSTGVIKSAGFMLVAAKSSQIKAIEHFDQKQAQKRHEELIKALSSHTA